MKMYWVGFACGFVAGVLVSWMLDGWWIFRAVQFL